MTALETRTGLECGVTSLAEVTFERSPRSGTWILVVSRCPFCGKRHSHGGGNGDTPDLGARRAHCITGPGGTYELVAPLPYGCPGCHVVTDRGLDRCSGCTP